MPYLCCEKCKVLSSRRAASQRHSRTEACVHAACSRIASVTRLQCVWSGNFPISVSAGRQSAFLLLASDLGYKYRNMLPGSKKGNKYEWLPGKCTRAISVCLCVSEGRQVQTHTRICRMFVRVPWLRFSTSICSDAYMRKSTVVTVKFYEILENRDFSLQGLTQCIFPELILSRCV